MAIFGAFEKAFCISLPKHMSRRKRADRQFKKVGIPYVFVEGIQCDDKKGFPSPGSRGCYLAHLKALERGLKETSGEFLIFEDDILIPKEMRDLDLGYLKNEPWNFTYFGYQLAKNSFEHRVAGQKFFSLDEDVVYCTHAYAVYRKLIPSLIEFLKQIHDSRPMHVDGAFQTFRKERNLTPLLYAGKPILQAAGFSDVTPNNRPPGLLHKGLAFAKYELRNLIY